MFLPRIRVLLCVLVLLLMAIVPGVAVTHPAAAATAAQPTVPTHLMWAERLLATIQPDHNVYGKHPSYIWWAGVDGKPYSANRTVCSSFVTHLLMQSYGLTLPTIRSWLGSTDPLAARYHDAIVSGNGFQRVDSVGNIEPGDFLAVKYLDHGTPGGARDSGHMMLVDRAPVFHPASAPIEPGTIQYDVTVIDSTGHGHGNTDTRLQPDGSWHTGAGKGVFRLYATDSGQIAGYTWSEAATGTAATYYSVSSVRNIVDGRFTLPIGH